MDENEALAICYANLRGGKVKNPIKTAQAMSYLRGLPQYSSNAAVGERVGVSREIVREFLALLRLPESVQQLLDQHKLGLEHGRKLEQLQKALPGIVEQVANEMTDMTAMDARNLVEYLIRHKSTDVQDAKNAVLKARNSSVREYHVVAELTESVYKRLASLARERKRSVNDLVSEVVSQWSEGHN